MVKRKVKKMENTPAPQAPVSNTDKKYKLRVLKKQASFSSLQAGIFVAVFAVIGGLILINSFAAPRPKTPPTTVGPLSSNVTQNWTNDPAKYLSLDHCFGVDDRAMWNGSGSLAPGESYTFNPANPTCSLSEVPAIVMHIDWSGDTDLKMQSKVGFVEQHNTSPALTPQILSKTITAPIMSAANSRKQANFCEFTDPGPTAENLGLPTMTYHTGQVYPVPINWSATITNTGTQTAIVNFSGQETNGWEAYYYPHCYRADSDGDHWNDALEESILNLSGLNNTTSTIAGSDYLNGLTMQNLISPNQTISASPADFNHDDVIDSRDVAAIQQYVGQGNSYSQDQIDPNAGCAGGGSLNGGCQASWERYDIDGDGYVTAHDVSEVQALVGKPLPLTADYLAPWAIVQVSDMVPANYSGYIVHAFASDNDFLTHVDIYAAGKLLCSTWGAPDNYGQPGQGLWNCGWNTPRRSGTTTLLTVNAYDDAGHVYSASKTVTTQ
jgi:hypothetical protein